MYFRHFSDELGPRTLTEQETGKQTSRQADRHLTSTCRTSSTDTEARWGNVDSPLAGQALWLDHAFGFQRTPAAGRKVG